MKLGRIQTSEGPHLAAATPDGVVDLTLVLGLGDGDLASALMPGDMRSAIDACLDSAPRLQEWHSLAPIARPGRISGVGMNYHSFVKAAVQRKFPLSPRLVWFDRPATCVSDPGAPIWLPPGADDLLYEAELAIIIGRTGCRLGPEAALQAIAGFTIANDVTLFRRVLESIPLGKSYDSHLPIGPWAVPADRVAGQGSDLKIRTWVNGELRQEGATSDMIKSCGELICAMSEVSTVHSGDIILTGTPYSEDVFRTPPRFLQPGDHVKIEIEGIGLLENMVFEEEEEAGDT